MIFNQKQVNTSTEYDWNCIFDFLYFLSSNLNVFFYFCYKINMSVSISNCDQSDLNTYVSNSVKVANNRK